jgi:O-antigen ligase
LPVLSISLPRFQTQVVVVSVTLAVLCGVAYGTGLTRLLIAASAVVAFAVLVRDLRLIVPVLIVAMPFGPKYAMPFGNLYVTTAIVMVGFAAWLWRNPFTVSGFSFPSSGVLGAILVLLSALLLSAVGNLASLLSNAAGLLRFVQFSLYALLYAVLLQLRFSRSQIRKLLVLVLVAGVAEGVVGAWQWLNYPGFYVAGTFDAAHNNFAVYIIFISLLLIGVLFESRKRLTAMVTLLGLAILVYSVVFSFSRGGYIAFAAGILVFMIMPLKRYRKLVLVAGCVAAVAVTVTVVPRDVIFRARTILLNLSGEQVGTSFGERLRLWKVALADFARSPIIGKGTWSYGLRDNFFMKVLGEAGILGFGAFIWLLWVVLREEWRAICLAPKDDLVRGVTVGLLPATVACLIVFNLSGDFFLVHRFMGTFWIVLALVAAYSATRSSTGQDD